MACDRNSILGEADSILGMGLPSFSFFLIRPGCCVHSITVTGCLCSLSLVFHSASLADEETPHPSYLTGEPAPERAEVFKVELLEFGCLADVSQEGNVQV